MYYRYGLLHNLHIHPEQLIDLNTGQPLGATCLQADPGYTLASPEMSAAYTLRWIRRQGLPES